ncbi:nucleic acid-binding protein [Halobacterium rubrum]|uniref:nucleic acid-binding protein n=1 Tax=Halobacterium TaxID=2239 RepID=UPI001F399AA6|nr:nucleic acid-binding protein [Halobacterium rubrum]MDH5020901.1 nucleic acid-binding protein [Halobacterium rubrum]
MTTVAVSDAGPLIHLAEIGSLELLDAFDTLLVPEVVHDEVEVGGLPDGLSEVADKVVAADGGDTGVGGELDAGERAAISVARGRELVLLTDDLAAREVASEAGIDVHGSIGVIALGYSRGLLDRDEAASRMRALQRETSLFVTEAVVERGIRLLDER